jgi:uncharacterized protein (DUF2147 family)
MRILQASAAAAAVLVAATAAFAQSPFGTWTRPSNGTKVDFYACGGKLCAKVVASAVKANEGKVIMSGADKTGDNQWKGSLLNLEDGQTYSGVVTLEGPKALNLKGCVLGGIVCKGETWVR